MGRNSGSDAQDAGTIRRLSTTFSSQSRESSRPGAPDDDGCLVAVDPAGEDAFGVFAEAIRRELAPRSRLERVLADRVVLSAWTLHVAGVEELASIRNSPTPRSVDTSPDGIFVVVQCLEKSLDLLRRLREDAQPLWGRPDPSSTTDDADAAPLDGEDLDLCDSSNEWPVIPRGRKVVDDPDDADRDGEPVLAGCWHDRLVFDLNVSEHSPVVKGTWVTVSHVLSLVVDGWTWSEILRTHPELNVNDIRTCLAYTVAEGNGET